MVPLVKLKEKQVSIWVSDARIWVLETNFLVLRPGFESLRPGFRSLRLGFRSLRPEPRSWRSELPNWPAAFGLLPLRGLLLPPPLFPWCGREVVLEVSQEFLCPMRALWLEILSTVPCRPDPLLLPSLINDLRQNLNCGSQCSAYNANVVNVQAKNKLSLSRQVTWLRVRSCKQYLLDYALVEITPTQH